MAKTALVALTADDIDGLFDAIDDQVRHWESCGGDAEENARYARIIASLNAIARRLENARDQLEDD